MAGVFHQPRNLSILTPEELDRYSEHCSSRLVAIEPLLADRKGEHRGLSDGFKVDGFLAVTGLVIAGVGIAITTVATAGGILGLAGGALSLMGVQRYGDRSIKRGLLEIDRANYEESIKFWRGELARIDEELNRRGRP